LTSIVFVAYQVLVSPFSRLSCLHVDIAVHDGVACFSGDFTDPIDLLGAELHMTYFAFAASKSYKW
jgi:hypothetical protein